MHAVFLEVLAASTAGCMMEIQAGGGSAFGEPEEEEDINDAARLRRRCDLASESLEPSYQAHLHRLFVQQMESC